MSDKFTIEDGDTLYFGRDDERHGYNLGQLTDRSFNALDILNAALLVREKALAVIDRAATDREYRGNLIDDLREVLGDE